MGDDPDDAALAARFARIPAVVNADASLRRRGALLTAELLVGLGSIPMHVSIMAGEIVRLETGPGLMWSWRFAVRGSGRAWSAFWRPVPAPGWHDLFALAKRGEVTIEGDLRPFVAHMQYIKDVLATPRFMAEA